MDEILARALAKDPHDRPGTCAELAADLRHAFEAVVPDVADAEHAAPTLVLADPAAPTRRLDPVHRSPRRSASALLLLALLACAGAVAALLATSGTHKAVPSPATTTERASTESASPDRSAHEVSARGGAALNDLGYARMRAGDLDGALPLLRRAVLALRGTRTLAEAYASYNLAYTRFALGRCDGVLGLLDRSEGIQGRRSEIDALRTRWNERCGRPVAAEAVDDDDASPRGKANGRGKGRGSGRGKGHD